MKRMLSLISVILLVPFLGLFQSCDQKIKLPAGPSATATATPSCSILDTMYDQPVSLITANAANAMSPGEAISWQETMVGVCSMTWVVDSFNVYAVNGSSSSAATLELGLYNANGAVTTKVLDTDMVLAPGASGWQSLSMAVTVSSVGTLTLTAEDLSPNVSIGYGTVNPGSDVLFSFTSGTPLPSLATLIVDSAGPGASGFQTGVGCPQMYIGYCVIPCSGG